MKILCALSITVRLTSLAFVVGLALGLALGYRAATEPAPGEPAPVNAARLPASESPSSPPAGFANLDRPLRIDRVVLGECRTA